eukprot:GDKJ01046438.1.p1 GENE.GDKJ01046438.1~~GDKJ01046438.1.p1  ORF type:complete len:353 (+),score=29.40 GDKJ01046438.1:91-1059(+)
MIQQEVTRDELEAKEEIRRRARCERSVQCEIVQSSSSISNSSISPQRDSASPVSGRPKQESAFLNLAQQERDRHSRNTVTTALTQTDPVIVMEYPEEGTEGLSPNIPTLAIGNGSVSPGAVFALTNRTPLFASHPSSVISTARETEPLTARDLQHFSINSGTPRSSLLTSRQLTSRVAMGDTLRMDASPEISEHPRYLSIPRSPGTLVLRTHAELLEDARVENTEEIEENDVTETSSCTSKNKIHVDVSCNTELVDFIHPSDKQCTEVSDALPKTVKSLLPTDGVSDRVGSLLMAIKGELDQDGHFAALFVTGMLASFMFAR